ncbi:MAG TPA: hypothetical protein VML36_00825 [Nitrospiria bacterium]|nr:hypothetical protein [Nitrospiria bacterium]
MTELLPTPDANRPEEATVDATRARHLAEQRRSEQNLTMALLAGGAAALAGAVLWAIVTAITHYQFGIMAIAIGFLVGVAVLKAGKGVEPRFGIAGAILAGLGCAVGNLLVGCVLVANQEEVGVMQVLDALDVGLIKAIMAAIFRPMDLLFYAIALYEGFRFSYGRPVLKRA